ncbi:MAG: glycosyltransferase family 2 protein [Lachnospiraceae bacterium]|nr:glycosyltransferase family 2 protein [Lachnospiraceae bacterium]
MDKPIISLIIPVYNTEKHLEKCLNRVIDQTYKNLDIILVDDGSTDESGRICDSYAERDSRIRVFHKINGGVSDSRNLGLDKALGEYIGFVDSDDLIDIQFIEVLYSNAVKHDAGISACGMYGSYNITKIRKNIGQCLHYNSSEEVLRNLFTAGSVLGSSCCNKLFRREIVESIRYKNYVVGEDVDYLYECIMNNKKSFVYDNRVLYLYLYHDTSSSRGMFSIEKLSILTVADDILSKTLLLSDSLENAVYAYHLRWHMCVAQNIYNACNKNDFKSCIDDIRKKIKGNLNKYLWNPCVAKGDTILYIALLFKMFGPVNCILREYRIITKSV